MSQPIRKAVAEAHPDIANKEKPRYILLVDGGNLLTISFADTKVNGRGEHYGAVFQFLLQMRMMMTKRPFDEIYVFFDDEDSGILRYELYHDYKANRDKHYEAHKEDVSDYMKQVNDRVKRMRSYFTSKNDAKRNREDNENKSDRKSFIDANFARERDMLMSYFEEMSIRCIFNDKTEGDDLIAYYVLNKRPEDKVVIMSTDEDLTQLLSEDVCVYNTIQKKVYSDKSFKALKGYPYQNVLIKKIFCGDTSDNIGKIDGVSESRFFELIPEAKERPVSVDEVRERARILVEERVKEKRKPYKWQQNIVSGYSKKEYDGDFYEINEKIINLKKPLLTEDARQELESIMHSPLDPEGRSFSNLYQLLQEDGIEELLGGNRFDSFFSPFKILADREKMRFEREK